MDQNGSKWIDQTRSNYISDEVIIEIYHQTYNFFWSDLIRSVKMDKNGSKWIKIDQNGSNWISDELIIEIYHQVFNLIYLLIRFSNFLWSKWIRSVQTGSNLIKLNFWWNYHWNISSDFQSYLSFDQIESDLSKIVNIIKFAILSLSLFLVFNHFDNIG